jgi:predicted nucleic acid-binding protein
MIILDTNVISEALKQQFDTKIQAWLDSWPENILFTTAVTIAELRTGLEVMPIGKRRAELTEAIERRVVPLFYGKLLPFDVQAAEAYAAIFSDMRRRGRAIGILDCQIAAIAKSRGFSVATRDVQPFADAGLSVIDPWNDGSGT